MALTTTGMGSAIPLSRAARARGSRAGTSMAARGTAVGAGSLVGVEAGVGSVVGEGLGAGVAVGEGLGASVTVGEGTGAEILVAVGQGDEVGEGDCSVGLDRGGIWRRSERAQRPLLSSARPMMSATKKIRRITSLLLTRSQLRYSPRKQTSPSTIPEAMSSCLFSNSQRSSSMNPISMIAPGV